MALEIAAITIARAGRRWAIAPHCDVPHRGGPYGKVEGTLRCGALRPRDERGDRIRGVHRAPRDDAPYDEIRKFETIFPQRKEPWYQATDKDVRK
jgi:hypothetical protein